MFIGNFECLQRNFQVAKLVRFSIVINGYLFAISRVLWSIAANQKRKKKIKKKKKRKEKKQKNNSNSNNKEMKKEFFTFKLKTTDKKK